MNLVTSKILHIRFKFHLQADMVHLHHSSEEYVKHFQIKLML